MTRTDKIERWIILVKAARTAAFLSLPRALLCFPLSYLKSGLLHIARRKAIFTRDPHFPMVTVQERLQIIYNNIIENL